MSKRVFEIVESGQSGERTWRLRGRAYNDIRIGDEVFVETARGDISQSQPYRVIAISTYGQEVEELSRMLTGDLIVQGDNCPLLRQGTMLVSIAAND